MFDKPTQRLLNFQRVFIADPRKICYTHKLLKLSRFWLMGNKKLMYGRSVQRL